MFKPFYIVFALLQVSLGAKILAVFPSYGYSQFFVGQPLLKHLASRGHEITLLSAHKPKEAIRNVEVIRAPGVFQMGEASDINFLELLNWNILDSIRDTHAIYGVAECEQLLNDTNVQKLLRSNRTFDLVLQEFWSGESLMALASHFNAPLVIFCTTGASEWTNHLALNPAPFSYAPHSFSGFSTNMTLWQRARNFFLHSYFLYLKYFVLLPKHGEVIRKYIPNPPEINEVAYNASLILLNSHPSVTPPYPLASNMIEIGGFHIDNEALPRDVKEFLDDAPHGVIYFCMGSNIKSKDLGEERIGDVLKVFAGLKQKLLWKFEAEELPNKPDNVAIRKWLPQRAVLAHPNVKLFISHCGLIGTIETVYFAKPIICIPIFVDQATNAAVAQQQGIATTLHFEKFNARTLKSAILEMLTNKRYTENVRQRSLFFREAPVKPMDLATWWIEFVAKHKGAPHLRSPALNLRWYQYYYIDFVCIAAVATVAVFCVVKRLFRKKKEIKRKTS